MKVFLICPVRNATEQQIERMRNYKNSLREQQVDLYYPADDNVYEHTDKIGYVICETNVNAIKECDEVHIFWDKNSSGSLFDLGAAFALGKRLRIANINEVECTQNKSFANMILEWNKKSL